MRKAGVIEIFVDEEADAIDKTILSIHLPESISFHDLEGRGETLLDALDDLTESIYQVTWPR